MNMTLIDQLAFAVCALIVVLCVVMLREQTTLKCAPAHIGLGAIGFAAFLYCVSLLHDLRQAHWPGLALHLGLAACLAYLALTPEQRARWDGRTERRRNPARDRHEVV